jgi:pimeloyl-ACP methyl ester carboxylesterase
MSFQERYVEADGFRIRYLEAGQGEPLIWFHGGGGLQLNKLHELLAAKYRLIALEVPGFGGSPVNQRTKNLAELAATMGAALAALGVDRFDVMGISFGGALTLWTTILLADRVKSAILLAPAAYRPNWSTPPTPEQMHSMLYAHPERVPPAPPPSPELTQKQMALAIRVMAASPQAEMEARMKDCTVPVLVLMGTEDRLIPPAMGRHYRELLPDCYLVMVYDAAHALDVDRPEACFAVIDDFLKRQGKFIVSNEDGAIFP